MECQLDWDKWNKFLIQWRILNTNSCLLWPLVENSGFTCRETQWYFVIANDQSLIKIPMWSWLKLKWPFLQKYPVQPGRQPYSHRPVAPLQSLHVSKHSSAQFSPKNPRWQAYKRMKNLKVYICIKDSYVDRLLHFG